MSSLILELAYSPQHFTSTQSKGIKNHLFLFFSTRNAHYVFIKHTFHRFENNTYVLLIQAAGWMSQAFST